MMSQINENNGDIWKDKSNENTFFVEFAVKPNAKRDLISLDFGGKLKLEIKAVPIKNKANKAILKFLSKKLHIPVNQIQLVKGMTNSTKIFKIKYENCSISKFKEKLLV